MAKTLCNEEGGDVSSLKRTSPPPYVPHPVGPPRAISGLNLFCDTHVFYRRLAPRGAALASVSCNMSLRVDALALADGRSGPVADALCVYAKTGLRTLLATKCAAALRNAAGQELELNAKQVARCEHSSCTSTRVVLVEACTSRRRCIEHCNCDACNTAVFAFAVHNADWSFDVPLGTTSAKIAADVISFDELRRRASTAAPVEEEEEVTSETWGMKQSKIVPTNSLAPSQQQPFYQINLLEDS